MKNRLIEADLKTILDDLKNQVKAEMHCACPGRVESFDSANQTATVSLSVKKVMRGGITFEYPTVQNCPVMFLTGGSSRITMPITAGDPCLLIFCDREIDTWWSTEVTSAPKHKRKHDFVDCIAIVGIKSQLSKVSDYNTSGPEIRQGTARVSVEDKIRIEVATVTLKAALDDLCTALTSWVDTGGQSPNVATVAAINAFKTKMGGILL
jgi:hypothetical protein